MGTQKYSEAEARNRQRREAEGAYFASPADAVGNPAAKKAKSPLPFGLELEPDEFKKPANFDEMSSKYIRLAFPWTLPNWKRAFSIWFKFERQLPRDRAIS